MEKQLHKGTTLVVDRYAYSGVAFTAAKDVSALVFLYLIVQCTTFNLLATSSLINNITERLKIEKE